MYEEDKFYILKHHPLLSFFNKELHFKFRSQKIATGRYRRKTPKLVSPVDVLRISDGVLRPI